MIKTPSAKKPEGFGFIRKGGVLADVVYKIFDELETITTNTDITPAMRLRKEYFEMLLALAVKKPMGRRRIKNPGSRKNKKKVIEAKLAEKPSGTDWGKKLGGE